MDTYDMMVDSRHIDIRYPAAHGIRLYLRVTGIPCLHLFRLLSLMLNSASRHGMATNEGPW